MIFSNLYDSWNCKGKNRKKIWESCCLYGAGRLEQLFTNYQCKRVPVTRAQLQELMHRARLSVAGGTPQNPWGKRRLRSPRTLFLTRRCQIRSKSTDAVVLGRGSTLMCEKRETPSPRPSFLLFLYVHTGQKLHLWRVGWKGKAANPWAGVDNHCRWGRERRNSAPGRAAAVSPEPTETAWGEAGEWRRSPPRGQGTMHAFSRALIRAEPGTFYNPS